MKVIKIECVYKHAEALPFEEPEERAGFLVRNEIEFCRKLACLLNEPDDADDLPGMDRPIISVSLENISGRADAAPVRYELQLVVLIPAADWALMDDSANALNLSALVLQKLEREILFFAHEQKLAAREEAREKKIGDTCSLSFKEFVDRVNAAETTDADADTRKEGV